VANCVHGCCLVDPRIAEQEVVERVEGAGVGDKNGAGRVAQGKAHLVSVLAEAGHCG